VAENPIVESRAPKRPDPDKDGGTFVSDARMKLESWFRVSAELRENTQKAFEMNFGGKRQWRTNDAAKLDADKRPVQAFNICHPAVNFLAGYQSEREQDYRAFPRGSEDEQIGRLTTALMKYGMDAGGGSYAQHGQFRKGIIGGCTVMEIGHSFDYTDDLIEGDVNFTTLPQNAWACDPSARRYDRNDAWWQAKLIWMNREDAKRKFGERAEFKSFTADWAALGADLRTTGVPEQLWSEYYLKDTNQIRLIQYWYRKPVKAILVVNTANQEIYRFTSQADAEKFLKSVRDQAGQSIAQRLKATVTDTLAGIRNVVTGEIQPMATMEDADAWIDTMRKQAGAAVAAQYEIVARDVTVLKVAHLTAWDMLKDGPTPYPDDFWRYPFSPFIPYQDTDDLYAIKGILFDLFDVQEEVNWNHSTLQDELVRGPKSGWWLPPDMKEQIPDLQEKIHRSGFMGSFASVQPQPIMPQPISDGFMRLMQMDMDLGRFITGINAELVGQTTQKTVSGRAIAARQAGGLVGLASMMLNWKQSREYQGRLLLKRIQQFYSEQKMLRIIGENQRMAKDMGLLGQAVMPDEQLLDQFKKIKNLDFDIKVDFQEASPTARQAVFTQLMQLTASGWPTPPDILLESSDVGYKEEMKAALKAKGMQPPNPDLAKVLGAGQGMAPSGPDGVNTSQ